MIWSAVGTAISSRLETVIKVLTVFNLYKHIDTEFRRINFQTIKGDASPSIYADWVNGGWL